MARADGLELIPAGRREAVRSALDQAFGARPLQALRVLAGGVSGAMICRIEIEGRPFVLRLEPERIELRHRQRAYGAMAAAAAAGVAPAIRYADALAGVAVMDFIAARPLAEPPGAGAGLVRSLGGLFARLRETPLFPPLAAAGDPVANALQALDACGLFAPGLLAAHAEGLALIRAVHPWNTGALVSSHNDPNPRNLLFDGARLWLVDWELAAANDPLFDPAIATLELATTPALEDALLAAAFGRAPNAALKAQLALARLLARLFYGCIALEAFANAPRAKPETSLAASTPAEFLAAARTLAPPAAVAWAFGLMSLRAFADGLRSPALAAAVRVLR